MAFSLQELITTAKNGVNKANNKFNELKSKFDPPVVNKLTYKDVRTLDRPAPTWRWDVNLPEISGKTLPGLFCETVDLIPGVNLNQKPLYYKGVNIELPGTPSFEKISAVFYETESYRALDYFVAWENLVYNQKNKVYGVLKDYGKTVTFNLLPVIDVTKDSRYAVLTFIGCWPTSMRQLSYNNETDRIKIQVEFVYYDTELQINGLSPSSAGTDAGTLLNKLIGLRR